MPTKSGWKFVDGKAAADKRKKKQKKHRSQLREEEQKKAPENRVRHNKMDLDRFCAHVVPDFTPLGGNRPDCAVVMAAVVSLWENPRWYRWIVDGRIQHIRRTEEHYPLLPPDVLDTAMAVVCAAIIIHSASDRIKTPPENATSGCDDTPRIRRLSCRLKVESDGALYEFCNDGRHDVHEGDFEVCCMPWRNFHRVCLQITLADSITYTAAEFLRYCGNLISVDLRNTKLQTVRDHFMSGCIQLTEVKLPDTLQTVGPYFLLECSSLVSIDLRNTKLHTVGERFMFGCQKLTAVHLPDTLRTVGCNFFNFRIVRSFYGDRYRSILVSIDLRNTKLHTAGDYFMPGCKKLTEVQFPDTLHTVGSFLLQNCTSLASIDLRNTKIETVGSKSLTGCEKLTKAHLPDTVHTVGYDCLRNCSSLISVDLRNTKLHTVRDHFMSGCTKLTELKLPDTLQTVGHGFLRECHSLVSIDLRNTKLHTAGNYFVFRCHQLAEIHLPETLQTVGASFLADCSALAEEEVARKKRDIGNKDD